MTRKLSPLFLVFLLVATSVAQVRTVAVFPLQSRGVDTNSTRILEDALANELVSKGTLRLLERTQMNAVLAEQGFQQSGTCDASECAIKMGQILGVERGVVGSVGLLGRTWVLNARIVDVSTGEVLQTSQRSLTGEIDRVLIELVPQVAADLTRTRGSAATPAKAKPTPAPVVQKKSSSAWIWWTLGGVTVLGGAAAAAVLLMNDDKSGASGGTTDNGQPTDNTIPVTVTLP